MLGAVLLCCCSVTLLRGSSSLVHGHLQVDEVPLEENQDQTYFSEMDRLPPLIPINAEQNQFLLDTENYEQGRSNRSPRRCVPHQQSCLGFALPCCDSCDTCYCRFFNAICYCRRVGHTCPSRRT